MFKTKLNILFFVESVRLANLAKKNRMKLKNPFQHIILFNLLQQKVFPLNPKLPNLSVIRDSQKFHINYPKGGLLENTSPSRSHLINVLPSNVEPQIKDLRRSVETEGSLLGGVKSTVFLRKIGGPTNYNSVETLKTNTYLPLLSLQNKVRTSFLKKNLITTLFTLQLSHTINSPIFFKLCAAKLIPIFLKYHITYIFKKFKRYGVFFGGPVKLMEFVLISFLTIISKDLNYFTVWLKGKFESVFYRKHKKLLYLIKLFFVNYVSIYLNMFRCRGFYLRIKGKIGVGGNSKKKRYLVKIGKHSLTSKRLKFTNHIGVIRTLVGTLGVKVALFYA